MNILELLGKGAEIKIENAISFLNEKCDKN